MFQMLGASTFGKYLHFYNTTKLHISFSLLDHKNICKLFNKAGFVQKGLITSDTKNGWAISPLKTIDHYLEGTGLISNDDSD